MFDNSFLGNYISILSAIMSKPKKLRAVSDLKSHTGFWLRFVSNHVSQAFARKLLSSGVTVAEWVVLREMYGRDDLSPGQLAESTGLTRGAISKLVDRLVEKKLVTRIGRSDDRRFQDITLSAEGQRSVPMLAAIADQNDREFFDALSHVEHDALLRALKKVVRSHDLKKIPTE